MNRRRMVATNATVLDVCCGSRMFWMDRHHPDTLYVDKRRETHVLSDNSSKGGSRTLAIEPDLQADFTALPSHWLVFQKPGDA